MINSKLEELSHHQWQKFKAGILKFAYVESARQLSAPWVAECRNGVEGMKPRFVKTGVQGFPLEEVDVNLVEASAITSLETGLPI